jgi:hypothetical protein
VESAETYRLGSEDLKFAELLPGAPRWIDDDDDDEYDPQSRLAFQVGRIATALTGLRCGVLRMSLVDAESSTADTPDTHDAP